MEVALRWETLEAANSWDINLSKNQRVVSEHIKIGPDRTFLARDFWPPKKAEDYGLDGHTNVTWEAHGKSNQRGRLREATVANSGQVLRGTTQLNLLRKSHRKRCNLSDDQYQASDTCAADVPINFKAG